MFAAPIATRHGRNRRYTPCHPPYLPFHPTHDQSFDLMPGVAPIRRVIDYLNLLKVRQRLDFSVFVHIILGNISLVDDSWQVSNDMTIDQLGIKAEFLGNGLCTGQ